MKEPVLVILAAGMGSRFGGLKQITPIGDDGEMILDFSLYDAYRAGFKKVKFIIKEENQEDFERLIGRKIRPFLEVGYIHQKLETCVCDGCVPEGRIKPWGTGHAVLCCRGEVEEPFAVINADDYYGCEAFGRLYDFLCSAEDDTLYRYAMVGYQLGNTLTENGFVSRGVCKEDEQHRLCHVTEHTKIERRGDHAVCCQDGEEKPLPLDAIVSMNMWAFTPSVLEELHLQFQTFLAEQVPKNPLKSEFFLPTAIDTLIQEKKASVEILSSCDQWYGVTYQQDRAQVAQAMHRMKQEGIYPASLWERAPLLQV